MRFSFVIAQATFVVIFSMPIYGIANDKPICTNASFDSDGDGWGWEHGESCRVVSATSATSDTNGRTVCGAGAIDPDNDRGQ